MQGDRWREPKERWKREGENSRGEERGRKEVKYIYWAVHAKLKRRISNEKNAKQIHSSIANTRV